jgi:hypothetical protein
MNAPWPPPSPEPAATTKRSRKQAAERVRVLQWVNPITGFLFVLAAAYEFWFTAAAFFLITVAGIYRYGMANRELATFDTTDDPR